MLTVILTKMGGTYAVITVIMTIMVRSICSVYSDRDNNGEVDV